MTYKIVKKDAGVFLAQDTIADISEEFNGEYIYYMFLGKHTDYLDPVNGVDVLYDNELTNRQAYKDMLYGKMIKPQNAALMIKRNSYVPNEVYAAYDDNDTDLFNKNFFVVVQSGSSYEVFKCLDNNNGSLSTIEPSSLDVAYSDEIYRTSDNYVWKYMYTITSSDMLTFSTDTLIPVSSNTEVHDAAVDGSIDVIKVEFSGSRYDNYLSGTIGSQDLIGDKQVNVSGNNLSSATDDFYVGCVFKITSGTNAGDYTTISEYTTGVSNRVITLVDKLTLDLSTTYEISPGVNIIGDYYQTSNAIARAIVDPATANSISYIEILNRGSGYREATAEVVYDPTVPVASKGSAAVVRPIMSPSGGHGHSANSELGASRACFSMTFNEASDGFPSKNDFRQVGIISNPRFSNVVINFTSKENSFLTGETIYKMDPVKMFGTAITVNTTSNIVTSSTSDFANSLSSGSYVYISGSGSKQLAKVVSVANSTKIILDSIGAFSCNDTLMYLANISGAAKVVSDGVDLVNVNDAFKLYITGDEIIGETSGAYGIVDNMEISGSTTDLSKFNQMWKYQVDTADTFAEDEVVYQESSATNRASLYSVVGESNPKTMYVTDQFGIVNTGKKLTGETSQASADVTNKYQPDLLFNSGRIIYLENLEPVARSSGQKETFKIIFEY